MKETQFIDLTQKSKTILATELIFMVANKNNTPTLSQTHGLITRNFERVILIQKGYMNTAYDLIQCFDDSGKLYVFLGFWNDGCL